MRDVVLKRVDGHAAPIDQLEPGDSNMVQTLTLVQNDYVYQYLHTHPFPTASSQSTLLSIRKLTHQQPTTPTQAIIFLTTIHPRTPTSPSNPMPTDPNPGLYLCPCGMNNGVWLVADASKCTMCAWTWGMYEAARVKDEERKRKFEEGREKERGK